MPDGIGKKINAYVTIRNKRRNLRSKAKDLKDKMNGLQMEILEFMENSNVDELGATLGKAYRREKTYPSVTDKEKFLDWVFENNAYEFVQSRCNSRPYRERIREGVELPEGIKPFVKQTVSIRKK